MSRLVTHPAQHAHLRYTYLILMLALNRPTLRTIQHCWSDCCPIELSFQLSGTFLSHKTPEVFLHFNHSA
ncbi:hypothetical protein MTR_8g046280 [Medicago truncatula]|uniref:Uncharacterized protein n=1 Tax=Medicago truncatula TaxID=3880 RepID=G7L8K3_MEDTR|nr:hypothetical protein MTR_8g046280 [Medicago truncatula]